MTAYPEWLHALSWAYLTSSFACAAFILIDEFRRPQNTMIMNLVWPITALYFGFLAVWGYFKSGLEMTKQRSHQIWIRIRAELENEKRAGRTTETRHPAGHEARPSREQVAVSVSHCGAGCTLGDIAAEWWVKMPQYENEMKRMREQPRGA
jgi:hypothetical protein